MGLLLSGAGVSRSQPLSWLAPGEMELCVFDVGYGLAALLRTEEATAMVDVGPPEAAARLAEALEGRGVSRIDHLFLSHGDPDHAGAFKVLTGRIPVGAVYWNGNPSDEALIALAKALPGDVAVRITPKGSRLKLPGRLEAVVLEARKSGPDLNAGCLVLGFEYGRSRLLFPADIPPNVQWDIAGEHGDWLRKLTWAVLPHHGDFLDDDFRKFLKSSRAPLVLSVGTNPYGLPRPEVVEDKHLKELILRTDKDGSLCFHVGSNGRVRRQ